jgi:hypothetical protein
MLRTITQLLVPSYRQKRRFSKRVVIVVPLSDRPLLTSDEQLSLRHLVRYLGRYDKYLIAPRGSPLQVSGFGIRYFPKKFFGSVGAHNRLLSAPGFYRTFADYEYIFFYHLDSLVFSDQLLEWCDQDVDWIGPPWLNCDDSPWVDRPRVGNGGFALLRVERARQVLLNRYRQRPHLFFLDLFTQNGRHLGGLINVMTRMKRYWPDSRLLNRVLLEWEQSENPLPHGRNNDMFWADEAVNYVPEFKVATFEQGLRFGFEAAPRKCFELAGGKLPFGCHAWARYDRSFWEPYLLRGDDDSASRGRDRADPGSTLEAAM